MTPEFTPHMTAAESSIFSQVIPKECSVLEFGSGGSTQVFLEKDAKLLISIDSDKEWLQKLLQNPVVATCHKYGKWLPLYTDIGEITNWGKPVSPKPCLQWLNYHQQCWKAFSERVFDIILIDGRFRVACVCQCLLRCSLENTLFIIHDFWERPHYHGVLAFLDVVAQQDTLGIFRPKQNIDWRAVSLLLQEHQFIFY